MGEQENEVLMKTKSDSDKFTENIWVELFNRVPVGRYRHGGCRGPRRFPDTTSSHFFENFHDDFRLCLNFHADFGNFCAVLGILRGDSFGY